jgi:hypothetical protein
VYVVFTVKAGEDKNMEKIEVEVGGLKGKILIWQEEYVSGQKIGGKYVPVDIEIPNKVILHKHPENPGQDYLTHEGKTLCGWEPYYMRQLLQNLGLR